MTEFVLNFVHPGSITPIHIVMDVTSLSYDEVKSVAEIITINA